MSDVLRAGRRRSIRPETGWSSLLLLSGMLLVVGLSVADARPLRLAGEAHGAMPVVALVAAGLVGFLLGGSRLGVVRAHLLGAIAAAAVLLVAAASAVSDGAGPTLTDIPLLQEQLARLSSAIEAELQLYLGRTEVPPAALTFLVLGALCWTTGQYSAFSVFRHRRAAPAIVASGGLLFLNEALPAPDPASDRLPLLVTLALFALLAMLLLVRLQLTAQGSQWTRRQIADSGEVRRRFLRSGAVFVLLAVLAATSLTAVARVPAQSLDEGVLRGPLEGLREELSRWLSVLAVDVTPRATVLDDRLRVADEWQQGSGVAFVADVDDLRGNYWWLSAFAEFDGQSWTRDDTSIDEIAARALIEVPVDASGAGPHEVTVTVTPRRSDLSLGTLVGPSEPLVVDRDVLVRSLGDREGLTEITFVDEVLRGGDYSVTSLVHDYEARGGSLTASQLRAAGVVYPSWIDRYLRVDDGASGPRTAELAAQIEVLARRQGHETPYDKARLLQDRLAAMDYSTSIVGLCDATENVPECLLRTETGFCQHFASTMVMALREMEIPARLVNGYLPGVRDASGRYEVPLQALHAWVEVYFPGVGWVRFDPTPGGELRRFEQRATDFAEGEPLPSAGPFSSEPPVSAASLEPTIAPSPSPGSPPASDAGGGSGPWPFVMTLAGLVALGLLGVVILLSRRLRRLPDADGGLAYSRIVALAARLGYGPRPSQTEYEYAASLSESLPSVRDDLHLVAHARVEQRYGRREVAVERRPALRRAYARIRTALVRLGWRRAP